MKLGLYITTLTKQSKKRSHGLFSKIFRTSLLILILGSTSAYQWMRVLRCLLGGNCSEKFGKISDTQQHPSCWKLVRSTVIRQAFCQNVRI